MTPAALQNTSSALECRYSLVREAQQMQQAGEQIEDRHEQAQGRHHIVRLAAAHDVVGLVQDHAGHQQHETADTVSDSAGMLEEDRGDARQESHQHADRQEAAHERQVAFVTSA